MKKERQTKPVMTHLGVTQLPLLDEEVKKRRRQTGEEFNRSALLREIIDLYLDSLERLEE